MNGTRKNRTVIIKTETFRSSGTDAIFTLGLDSEDSGIVGEIQELSFEDLCEIDEFLHAYVTINKKGGCHE